MMKKLAINGGSPVRKRALPPYRVMGRAEVAAAVKIVRSGELSRFLGTWHDDFYGGKEIRKFESEWADRFKVDHAISVNSATSGLFCAVGAVGAGPGDEIIVSPYTMTASSVAPLIYNAIPVFADIEKDYFCLDPRSVEERITARTKAIIVVDIFGQPYDADRINSIAKKHGLIVIEDAAQAPGAEYKGRFAGTLGDIGVYSLNYHKHINTGEGGFVVTNDSRLADRMRLIRNHAEAVIDAGMPGSGEDIVNMLGFNYRMTELQAAIGRAQLNKLKGLLRTRQENVEYLNGKLSGLECIGIPKTRPASTHAFYVHPIKFNGKEAGVSRKIFCEAVNAELMEKNTIKKSLSKVRGGYVKPLYLQPLYQNRIAYGNNGCPWNCRFYKGSVDYSEGTCPVAEEMHNDVLIVHDFITPGMGRRDLDDVARAFEKVSENVGELKPRETRR